MTSSTDPEGSPPAKLLRLDMTRNAVNSLADTKGLVEQLRSLPPGTSCRTWTIRDDNAHHYHGQVRSSESPLCIRLLWRASSRDPVHEVGYFRLNLAKLLARGFIREERSDQARGDLRVRFVSANRAIYLQARPDEPRLFLGTVK